MDLNNETTSLYLSMSSSRLSSSRLSSRDIDELRQENAAYRYLCHLEEARLWMQECIQENLPRSTELEVRLRNGVYFAKLGNFIAPHAVPRKKIFDSDQKIYNVTGLHYRHTDNINYWILAMKAVGLPSYFYPSCFDIYGKKNMPKAIYCLHALNLYLHRCGKSIKIIDLMGKIKFSLEEINSVSTEFKKFGIQLPSFHKIGWILSKEITPNEATLHAAVISINIAICNGDSEHLFATLMNPNAQLQNIFEENAQSYQVALSNLKSRRTTEMSLKHLSNTYEPCWDFLTHKIIQEEIDSVNMVRIISNLKSAVFYSNVREFLSCLKHPLLNVSDVITENASEYIFHFKEVFKDNEDSICSLSEIQSLVSFVNYNKLKNHEIDTAVISLNNILSGDDYFASFNILKSIVSDTNLYDVGRQFYHLKLKSLREIKKSFLNLHDIQINIPTLTALLDLSLAVIQCKEDEVFKALSNPVIKSWELNVNLKSQYLTALSELKHKNDLDFLSTEQIKNCITSVNVIFKQEQHSFALIENVKFALSQKDTYLLLNALSSDSSILCVHPKNKDIYLSLLLEYKGKKSECDILTSNEIQNQINVANKLVQDAEYFCACLTSVNISIDKNDSILLFDSLKTLYENESLCVGCKEKYLTELKIRKQEKYNNCPPSKCITSSSWIRWDISAEQSFYLNLKTLETAWNLGILYSIFLNKNDISDGIIAAQNECYRHKYKNFETCLISLQSHIRGYVIRQNYSFRAKVFKGIYTPVHNVAALRLQSFFRMCVFRKRYLKHKANNLKMHTAARLIQRQWRMFKLNQNLNILAHSSKPPLSLMQNITYMLEISNDDYSEEFELHTVKGKVVQTIRYNKTLLREIDEMDIKIGLLIRNRITLEDLLKQKKKQNVKLKKREITLSELKNRSFKLFSKKYNSLIESYENLLYLLQTKPVYLSRLIVSLPSNLATSLIESIIFSLYNFGSTPREEYLLLKMLSLTLEEDIKQKGDNISDIIKGENIIMKIIISFYRQNYWRDSLKLLLQPLVLEVLEDKSTLYSMDPTEIYKVWQNELEMQSGKKSLTSHDVTVEEALCHLEVNNRFNSSMDSLLKYSLKFCEAILNGQSLIPYGMMYILKVLKRSLQRKYPTSSTEELNKIIGNFLYYRYINPAIIAPDVYGIITFQYNEKLADYERLKLSNIAKFLHFSVTGQKYAEDMSHLMCLNPYLRDCHEQFMQLFGDVCKVKDLEKQFNIDIFSEAIVQIPEVYLSLNELQTLYQLLCEKEYDLAPDSNDVLHEILEDLNVITLENSNPSDDFLSTEICLSLKNKYDLDVEEEPDEEKVYIETKFIILTLLKVFCNVNTITDLYEKDPTVQEEMKFEKLCYIKLRDTECSYGWIRKSQNWKTLSALQAALHFNLNSLELCGYVSSTNNYQEILNDIAKDIINRWRYRISCKREILQLLEIQKQLDSKTLFYMEKLDYYNKYIAACLENMKIGKQNNMLFFFRNIASKELRYKKSIKCTGSKLHEKGILLEIKDLDLCQFKNVHFEISPSEDLGIFTVKAKFMNISLDTIEIDIQELLDMQYQGISEMNMFDSVKINNNLLLHFLNSKFYGKYLS